MGVTKGDTRSLDDSSYNYCMLLLGSRLQGLGYKIPPIRVAAPTLNLNS